MCTFFNLNLDKNKHFSTTYQPHLVHLVFEQPLNSNAARRRCLAAPSILTKFGGEIALPAPPPFIDAPAKYF